MAKAENKAYECDPIPVIVGVTGHRNVKEEDKPAIKEQIKSGLREILELCRSKVKGGKDTPVIMLNALAQGADMLCADAAFEMGVPVYAVLPCEEERYALSFDDDKRHLLHEYLEKCANFKSGVPVAPNAESNYETMGIDKESYEYRQVGIHIAEHCHVLIALWDGKEPKTAYGCGTAEVVKFALKHNFLNADHIPVPGTINDTVVMWIKSRREPDGGEADVRRVYRIKDVENVSGKESELTDVYADSVECPQFMRQIIDKTVIYNDERVNKEPQDYLWGSEEGLDESLLRLRGQYLKADSLANPNRDVYKRYMLSLSVLGCFIALFFLIYDDCSLPWMIYPCSAALLSSIIMVFVCNNGRKDYHRKYIEYRALAESLRTQFYLHACGVNECVCEQFSWTQKNDMVWIEKAIRALNVTHPYRLPVADKERIKKKWISEQLQYHKGNVKRSGANAKRYDKLSNAITGVTLAFYTFILLLEILTACGAISFWKGDITEEIGWRSVGTILMGVLAVLSLLLSSYLGNLSMDRRAADSDKMRKLYIYALENWDDTSRDEERFKKFVKSIAREEIVENGIWFSYVNENGLQVNV